ncbi:MAG: glycosyltransferase family A protein [Candidatus Bathyarchaeia archaeon]
MVSVLTLYITKDTIDQKCYDSVLKQKGVRQDVIVVSAKKIEVSNNFVVEVPQSYPLPVRVGLSINRALKVYWNCEKYDYLFKVDGDVLLPQDYLLNLMSKNKPIVGAGCAMLIEAEFFKTQFGSKWAVTYADDEYMKAYAFAMGFINELWEKDDLGISFKYRPPLSRAYIYGKEYYKYGAPIWFMCLRVIASIRNRIKKLATCIPISHSIYSFGGYVSMLGTKKYEWHDDYARRLTKLYFQKFISKIKRYLPI